jgi:hypothetical protein
VTHRALPLVAFALFAAPALADGPGDNLPDKVRRVPPAGIFDRNDERTAALLGSIDYRYVAPLGHEIQALRVALKDKPALLDLLPDVQIFYNAARYALTYNEIYDSKELQFHKELVQMGMDRAKELRQGKPSWVTKTGLVVRGYVSKIDRSVQPYGLVVPASYPFANPTPHRLDFWCHGRGEKLTELSFIQGRLNSPGEFTPPNAIVLHLYGRYCCANKFAGEVDLFEALENVKKHYKIDENRLVIRGFSMGGAACWQFAVHYAGMFAAAAPGAGFSETPEFLRVFQSEEVKPTDYQKKLWNLYDCPGYAVNLFNCPTVAYSGEIDRQKQAADVMAKAFEAEGLKLTHIIGPNTAHAYEKNAKAELNRQIDAIVEKGRDPAPKHVKFATYTLRYNRMKWLVVDGLEEHWAQARVNAELEGASGVKVTTKNVSAFTLNFESGQSPLDAGTKPVVVIDGAKIEASPVSADKSWAAHFRKSGGAWVSVASTDDGVLHKRHGLQGPIDDAFWDRFIMVKPTGTPQHEKTGAWVAKEQAHAIEHWRRQFRGEAIVKTDAEITDADIAASNLVLWGDPASNTVLAKIIDKLPIKWTAEAVAAGGQTFDAAHHVPVMIYPNPLNPKKYVVLNSGFTFREYDYLNNARQVPKLPDWAFIDVSQPVTAMMPGGVPAAGFFNEEWRFSK